MDRATDVGPRAPVHTIDGRRAAAAASLAIIVAATGRPHPPAAAGFLARRALWLAPLVACIVVLAVVGASQPPGATADSAIGRSARIAGAVTGGSLGLAGVTVSAYAGSKLVASTRSDRSGTYTLDVPAPATAGATSAYRIQFVAPRGSGYDTASRQIDVTAQGAALSLALTAGKALTGTVWDPAGGPVSGVTVSAERCSGDGASMACASVARTTTDAKGAYALSVPIGTPACCRLLVTRTGWPAQWHGSSGVVGLSARDVSPFAVPRAQDVTLLYALSGTLAGRAVSSVQVHSCARGKCTLLSRATPDADGAYAVLAGGTNEIRLIVGDQVEYVGRPTGSAAGASVTRASIAIAASGMLDIAVR